MEKRILVISNGNDGQIPFLVRMVESLRDPNRGNFQGRFIFLSDRLSPKSLKILTQRSILYHLIPQDMSNYWETLLRSEKHALG